MTNVAHHSDRKILKFPLVVIDSTFLLALELVNWKNFKSLQIGVSSHRKDRRLDFESSRRGQEVAGELPWLVETETNSSLTQSPEDV